jgi:hypothetical protein
MSVDGVDDATLTHLDARPLQTAVQLPQTQRLGSQQQRQVARVNTCAPSHRIVMGQVRGGSTGRDSVAEHNAARTAHRTEHRAGENVIHETIGTRTHP